MLNNKLLKHSSIIFIYSLIFFLSEIGYRYFFSIPYVPLKKLPEAFIFIALIVALFYFAKYTLTRAVIFIFFFLSIVANNLHYAVYQSWTNGLNYLLAVTEWHEVSNAAISFLDKVIFPAIWGIAESLIFLSIIRYRKTSSGITDITFLSVMLYMSIRSFTSNPEWGIYPQSTYSRIKSTYYTFNYFLGRILPYKLFSLSSLPEYSAPEPMRISEGKIKNIILIVGESESAANVSYFGYPRETTPFFKEVSQTHHPIIKPAYSAGMLTAIALPTFFNAIPYPNGLK